MKKKNYQIIVEEPCHEDWDKMTAKEQGRFCDSCSKVVVDFTSWSDIRMTDYLKGESSENLCGHFTSDQLNRNLINQASTPSSFSLRSVVLGASLTSLLYLESCKSEKAVTGKMYLKEETINNRAQKHLNFLKNDNKLVVKVDGKVLEMGTEDGIENVEILVSLKESGGFVRCKTNSQGKFSFDVHEGQEIEKLQVHKDGYHDYSLTYEEFQKNNNLIIISSSRSGRKTMGKPKIVRF